MHAVSSSLQCICEALVFEPLDVCLQIRLDFLCSTLALDLKKGEHAFLGSVARILLAQPGGRILLRYADVDVVPKPQEALNDANRPVLLELNSLFLPGMRLVDRIFNWIQLPRSTLCDLILAPPAVLVEIWFVTSSLDQQCQLIDHHARPTT